MVINYLRFFLESLIIIYICVDFFAYNIFGGFRLPEFGCTFHSLYSENFQPLLSKISRGEQDGGGVGGCGVHLSPWIHQEYTFGQRGACRTPAESGQEYLTSGKEHIESCKTW